MSTANEAEAMAQPAKNNQRKTKPPSKDVAIPPGMKAVHTTTFSPGAKPEDQANADFWLHPSTAAASVIQPFSKHAMPDVNCDALATNLRNTMNPDAYKDNSLAMLYGQAMALQTMFVELSRRAIKQDMLKQYEVQMRLALKAQNQCRMTLETLATVQNPPVVFAKQANINNGGQQQVNNGPGFSEPQKARACASADKSVSDQTELLENQHGQRLDFGAQATASRTDQGLETVGKVVGPEVRGG